MIKKIIFGVLLVIIVSTGTGYFYFDYRARTAINAYIDKLVASGSYEAMDYEDLRIRPNGDISITNLRIVTADALIVLQQIELSNLDFTHPIPRTLQMSVSGLSFPDGLPAIADAAMGRYLQSLLVGANLPIKMSYKYIYTPENSYEVDSNISISLAKAFTLNAKGIMRNVDLEALLGNTSLDSDPALVQMAWLQKLAAAEIPATHWDLKDEGMVAALIGVAAENSGQTSEAVRASLISQVRNLYLFLPQTTQSIAMSTGVHLAAFLEGGKTLSLGLTPKHEGNIKLLQQEIMGAVFTGDFTKVADLLGLEITAE